MKISQSAAASPAVRAASAEIGGALARLRTARRIQQAEAATRAGISRNTAYRLEKGDPGVALGQCLRYLEALAPGLTLQALLAGDDPSLKAQAARERTQRVRGLSHAELMELDF